MDTLQEFYNKNKPKSGKLKDYDWEKFNTDFGNEVYSGNFNNTPEGRESSWWNRFGKDLDVTDEGYDFSRSFYNIGKVSDEQKKGMQVNSLKKRLSGEFNQNYQNNLDQGKANLRESKQTELDDAFRDIDRNANQRGLLFSGKRDSSRAQTAAQKAGELGSATTGYENSLQDMRRNLNSDVIDSDIEQTLNASSLGDLAQDDYYSALKRKLAKQTGNYELAAQIGSVTGSGLGSLASKSKKGY